MLSQSAEFKKGIDNDTDLKNTNQEQDDDLKLPDVISDVNSS